MMVNTYNLYKQPKGYGRSSEFEVLHEFQASLAYSVRTCIKTKQNNLGVGVNKRKRMLLALLRSSIPFKFKDFNQTDYL